MNLKAGQTIIRANVILAAAAFASFVVSLAAPGWTWVPASVGMIAAVVLLRAHLRLARLFAGGAPD